MEPGCPHPYCFEMIERDVIALAVLFNERITGA